MKLKPELETVIFISEYSSLKNKNRFVFFATPDSRKISIPVEKYNQLLYTFHIVHNLSCYYYDYIYNVYYIQHSSRHI